MSGNHRQQRFEAQTLVTIGVLVGLVIGGLAVLVPLWLVGGF